MFHVEPPIEATDVLAAKTCKAHGLPLRPKQRNCHECNRLANEKYRKSLKSDLDLGRMLRKELGKRNPNTEAFKRALRAKPARPGFVYFIQADPGDEIKIGFSVDPAKRLKTLQTAASRALHILAMLPGMPDREYEIHQRFASHRTVGEWFKPAPEIMALIHEIQSTDCAERIAS